MRRGTALAMWILSVGAVASAQTEAAEVIARRELIDQAQAARDAGDHERALTLAEQAARLRRSPSLQLFIAQEQALTDRVLEAYANARTCEVQAQIDEDLDNREVIRATCAELARTLRTRIGMLVLRVPDVGAPVRVEVGGTEVSPALWGAPYSVLPGTVRVLATVADQRFEREVTIEAAEEHEIEIELDRIEPAAPPAPDPAADTPAAPAPGGLSSALFGIGAGLTGALAAGAIVTGVLAVGAHGGFVAQAAECEAGMPEACDAGRASRAEGTGLMLATNTLWVVTAIVGAGTLVAIPFTDFGTGGSAEVSATIDAGGLSLRLGAHF